MLRSHDETQATKEMADLHIRIKSSMVGLFLVASPFAALAAILVSLKQGNA